MREKSEREKEKRTFEQRIGDLEKLLDAHDIDYSKKKKNVKKVTIEEYNFGQINEELEEEEKDLKDDLNE